MPHGSCGPVVSLSRSVRAFTANHAAARRKLIDHYSFDASKKMGIPACMASCVIPA